MKKNSKPLYIKFTYTHMKLFLSTWSRALCTQIDLFGFVFFFQRLKLITFGENLLISEVINFRKIQIAKRKKKPSFNIPMVYLINVEMKVDQQGIMLHKFMATINCLFLFINML